MEANLWVFLSIGAIFVSLFLITVVMTVHKKSMKELEVEALRIKKADIQAEIESAVNKALAVQASRLEVLEAIVTDDSYQLNEKITRLK